MSTILPPLFKRIIEFFDSFPEISSRQALRLFFWLVKQDEKTKKKFLENINITLREIQFCQNCFFPTINKLCNICADSRRRDDVIAIVARETDVLTLESAKVFQGKYFILGGLILPFENKSIIRERLKILESRLSNNQYKEIIVALPYTREALPTIKHLNIIIKKFSKLKFTFLARGIPLGGEIEFIDPETIKLSFVERK